MLLDEATSALDAAHKIQIFDLLRQKNHQGTTLVCIMHDLNLAALYLPAAGIPKTRADHGGRCDRPDPLPPNFIGAV